MKRIFALAVVFTIVAAATLAHAEYGTWEDLYGFDPPGYSNASFLNVSVADYDHIFTVGMQQPAYDRIVYGWTSSTGGTSWNEAVVMNYDGSICDMMKMFTIIIGVESMGPDIGVYGGFGTMESCYDNLPEPWCMFICMLTLSPVIYYTNDGGETVQQAKLPFAFGKVVTAIDRAGDDIFVAVGGDDLILRSTDKGKTWENIPTQPGVGMSYSDVDFVDDVLGFVTTGESEEEPERTKDMSDEQWAHAIYQHRLNEIRWLHDPAYREEVRARYAANGLPKGMNGRIFKTVDGGNSWDEVLFSYNEAFGQIEMIDENEGWVWSSPLDGITPSDRVYRTTDGGETWVDYTDRIPLQELGGLSYGLMSFSFSPSGATGFIGGAGQGVLNFKSVVFYTIDRGETWHLDDTLLDWGHPVVSFDWVDDKVAYQAGADLSTYRYTQLNVPPIADAGPDQETETGLVVDLDGTGSYDPDGDEITYAWEQLEGEAVTIADADTATPSFTATIEGDYVFQLVVDDGQETGHDEATVTVIEAEDDDTADDDDDDDDTTDDDDDHASGGDDDDDNDDNGSCGC